MRYYSEGESRREFRAQDAYALFAATVVTMLYWLMGFAWFSMEKSFGKITDNILYLVFIFGIPTAGYFFFRRWYKGKVKVRFDIVYFVCSTGLSLAFMFLAEYLLMITVYALEDAGLGAVFYCMYFGTVSALLVGVRILISLAARWNRCRKENEAGKAIVFLGLFLAVLVLMIYCFWDVFVAVS